MVDALAQKADEGRAKLRNASRSCCEALYSGISEWENPFRFIGISHDEFIVM